MIDTLSTLLSRRRPSPAHTLLTYPCGLAEGDRLRLRRPLRLETETGSPVGAIIGTASVWTVLAGHPDEPDVVWFEDPRGELHVWDDASIWLDFEMADVDRGTFRRALTLDNLR